MGTILEWPKSDRDNRQKRELSTGRCSDSVSSRRHFRKVIGYQEQVFSFTRGGNRVRLAPVQQVQIRHRIIVIRSQRNRVFHGFDSLINHCPVVANIFFASLGRQRLST